MSASQRERVWAEFDRRVEARKRRLAKYTPVERILLVAANDISAAGIARTLRLNKFTVAKWLRHHPSYNVSRGSREGMSASHRGLTTAQIYRANKMRDRGMTHLEIAKVFHVERSTISRILGGSRRRYEITAARHRARKAA
jgi:hypothetical protein